MRVVIRVKTEKNSAVGELESAQKYRMRRPLPEQSPSALCANFG